MSDWQLDKRELDNYITKDDTAMVDKSEAWYRLFEDVSIKAKDLGGFSQSYYPYIDLDDVIVVVEPDNKWDSDFYGWTLTISFDTPDDSVLVYCHTRISTAFDGWTNNDVPESHLGEVKANLFEFVGKVVAMLKEQGVSKVQVKYMDTDAPEVCCG